MSENSSPGRPRATIVVMAKAPVPGQVKTRLAGALTVEQTSLIHAAMLDCTLERAESNLGGDGRRQLVLCLDRSGAPAAAAAQAPRFAPGPVWQVIEQGPGDLGARIAHAWRALRQGPAVFLGVDCPDVPAEALAATLTALSTADAAVGPVSDGGYWALAANHYAPALLERIDWGTAKVYDQTRAAAARAGLRLAVLASWYDVDAPADLAALRRRLSDADEPALVRLGHRLDDICK